MLFPAEVSDVSTTTAGQNEEIATSDGITRSTSTQSTTTTVHPVSGVTLCAIVSVLQLTFIAMRVQF